MRFSLILCTVGRTKEVERFLAHLDNQTYRDFELIVVDQNSDDRLVSILKPYQEKFPILHLLAEPGLSRARNVGLKYITGDVVAFPDDDCWYPVNLLERVAHLLLENLGWDGLTCRPIDEKGECPWRFSWRAGYITFLNVWQRAISYTIFLRKEVVSGIGNFDEQLGIGAGTAWGAGEETDYLLRALKAGFNLYYVPEIRVFHPYVVTTFNRNAYNKGYHYGMGISKVLRKHGYPRWFFIYTCCRSMGGICMSFFQGRVRKACYHWAVFQGRLRGYLAGG